MSTVMSIAGYSKPKQESPPPLIWDMYDIKPSSVIEPISDGLPVVASTGTPSMSREEAMAIKPQIDQEDLINTAYSRGETLNEEIASPDGLGEMTLMAASYNPTYDSCTGPQKILCAYDDVYSFYYVDFIPSTSETAFIATTSNLQRLHTTDTNTPDTMLYLLKCSDDYCTYGDVVAIDDNDNPSSESQYDSKISATLVANLHYRIMLVDKYHGAEGTADLSLKFGNYNPAVFANKAAGGWHVRNKTVKVGDSLFIGKNSNSSTAGFVDDREYRDSTLLYLTSSSVNCDASCGKFLFNDDYVVGVSPMFLSKVNVPTGYQNLTGGGRVIVGVADYKNSTGNWFKMNARLLHYRRSTTDGGQWSGSASYNDNDGDGLSWELENLLGSCDLIGDTPVDGVGIQGMSCQSYAQRVGINEWSPTDSDNDGINDGAEVFSIAVHCTQTPLPPYYDAGTCTRFGLHDAPTCPSGQYCIGVDVSALSDPNPNVYDVYVFNDYIMSGTTEYKITDDGQSLLKRTWHDDNISCWDGTAAPCDDPLRDLPYLFNIHAYSTHGTGMPVTRHQFVDGEFGGELGGGERWGHAYFNRYFKPEFKYTGIGYYSLSYNDEGGQSVQSSGRCTTWGFGHADTAVPADQTNVLSVFSHETGHLLKIDDRNYTRYGYEVHAPLDCPEMSEPDALGMTRSDDGAWPQYPAYPSLMNYGWNAHGRGMMPKTSVLPDWSDDPDANCSHQNLRFSKGLLGTVNEADLDEQNPISRALSKNWNDELLVREIECFDEAGRIDHGFTNYCDDDNCWVDWDYDRRVGDSPLFGPYSFDLSLGNVGAPPDCPLGICSVDCTNDGVGDFNDLGIIQTHGRENAARTFYNTFEIFKATFNASQIENLAGWSLPTTSTGVTYEYAKFPMNECYVDSDCPSASCRFDECTSSGDCRSGSCINGSCACSADSQCWSYDCLDSGKCLKSRGACECFVDSDCPGAAWDCDYFVNVCENLVRPDNKNVNKAAARFGQNGASYIKLTNSGAQSPFVAINDSNQASIRFDFMTEGSTATQPYQFIFYTPDLMVYLLWQNDDEHVRLIISGSSGFADVSLRAHHWYRVFAYAQIESGNPTWNIKVRPWSVFDGSWVEFDLSCDTCQYQCDSSSWNSDFDAVGDYWIGSSANGSFPFKGYLDNITIGNYIATGPMPECP